jgi:hypothetical protein
MDSRAAGYLVDLSVGQQSGAQVNTVSRYELDCYWRRVAKFGGECVSL